MRFDDKKFAEEYENRLYAEGYPGVLLDEIIRELEDARTVIDVGAGTGFFTLPLALRGFEVDAIEPSGEMRAIFRRKMSGQESARIRLHGTDWERWRGDFADALICVHSIYPMKDPRAAILKMRESAGRRILLARAASGTRNISDILRRELGRQRQETDFTAMVADILDENGLRFRSREIEQRRSFAFDDPDEEARYYCAHLSFDETMRPEVKRIILKYAENDRGRYLSRGLYRDTLFTF